MCAQKIQQDYWGNVYAYSTTTSTPGLSLTGPTGPQGLQGPQGPPGSGGGTTIGATGPTGSVGPTGSIGPAGFTGPAGTASLTGSTGPAGTAGPTGSTGPAGTATLTGSTGPTGSAGPTGFTGPAGTATLTGSTGPAGSAGPAGAAGPTGSAGPTGPAGGFSANSIQTLQNKTFNTSANTSISGFSSTTINTTFPHNLTVGDIVSFPNVGSMAGIAANVDYTVASIPTAASFTMTGVAAMAGTLGNAFYILKTRAVANVATSGGTFNITDASNVSNPVLFDVAGSTVPTVIQCTSGTGALRVTIPSTGGTLATLNGTQTFSGTKTFSSQLSATSAGQTTASNAGINRTPATTNLSGSNNYYFTYLGTPSTSGTTTGFGHTLHIQGAPSGPSNAAAVFIESGDLLMGPSANLYATFLRPVTGAIMGAFPRTDLSTGSSVFIISPSSSGWTASGVAELRLGDVNHYLRATSGSGVELRTFNTLTISGGSGVQIGTSGTTMNNMRTGKVEISGNLAPLATRFVSVDFGVTFASLPKVYVSLNMYRAGSTTWDQCTAQVNSLTESGCAVLLINNSVSATTLGFVDVVWMAIQ